MKPLIEQGRLRPFVLNADRGEENKTTFLFRPIPVKVVMDIQDMDLLVGNLLVLRYGLAGWDTFGSLKFEDVCMKDEKTGMKYLPDTFFLNNFTAEDFGELAVGVISVDKETEKN